MIRSIRFRITVLYVILILAALLGLGSYHSYLLGQNYLADLKSDLISEAKLIGDAFISQNLKEASPKTIQVTVNNWASQTKTQVAIINPNGKVVGDSEQDPELRDDNLSLPEVAQALTSGEGINTRISSMTGVEMIYATAAVYEDGRLTAIARVAFPLSQARSKIGEYQKSIWLTTLAASAIAIILVIWIARMTTSPLQKLHEMVFSRTPYKIEKQNRQIAPQQDIEQIIHIFSLMVAQIQAHNTSLEIERSKISAVLESMTDGAIIVEPDGLIQSINPAAERIFSISKNNALGQTLAEALRHHQLVEL